MKFLRANAPTLPLLHVQQIAREHFGLCGDAKALYSERDQNALFREADGRAWMLKIANTDEDPGAIDCQMEVLRHIQRVDPLLPVPRIRLSTGGQGTARVSASDGSAHIVYALSFLHGQIAGDLELAPALLRRIGALQARLGRAMRGFFHAAAGARSLLWDVRMAPQYLPFVDLLPAPQRSLVMEVLRRGIDAVLPRLDALRAQAIHGDLHAHNLILSEAGDLAGIIDFGDMIHGPLILDLSAALADFMVPASRIPQVLADMIRGYHEVTPLEAEERALLFDLVELRLVITMLVNAYRHTQTPDEPNYAADAGFGGWEALETLQRLTRAGVETIVDSACGIPVPHASVPVHSDADMMARRKRLLGSRPYLFYDRPIHAVRGEGVWIIDSSGRRFLDCYNNVPIVGHCHPHVTEAISRQSRTLNTNTRYLGEQVLDYAERLGQKTGAALTACAFVNSGSEANDVAWRIATAWTGARGALTQEFAYHGITEAIDAVSPSASRIGALAAHVRTLVAPDCYRGIYRGDTPDSGSRYAEDADRPIQSLAERRRITSPKSSGAYALRAGCASPMRSNRDSAAWGGISTGISITTSCPISSRSESRPATDPPSESSSRGRKSSITSSSNPPFFPPSAAITSRAPQALPCSTCWRTRICSPTQRPSGLTSRQVCRRLRPSTTSSASCAGPVLRSVSNWSSTATAARRLRSRPAS